MLFMPELLQILPAPSRAKVSRFDSDRANAHAALLTATEKWQAAHQRRNDLSREAAIAEAARERLTRFDSAELHQSQAARCERANAALETAKLELDAATAARDRATAAYRNFDFLSDVAAWVYTEAGPGVTFAHAAAVPVKGVKDFKAAVAAVRADLAELELEWRETETAPALAADLKAGLLAEIERIAAEGEPRIRPTMRGGGDPARLADHIGIRLHTYGGNLPVQTADLTARLEALQSKVPMVDSQLPSFLVWLRKPEIEARVASMVDAVDQAGAMSDAERDAKFETLAARRLEFERREESLIVQAEAAGMVIERRRTLDARAFLEIAA